MSLAKFKGRFFYSKKCIRFPLGSELNSFSLMMDKRAPKNEFF